MRHCMNVLTSSTPTYRTKAVMCSVVGYVYTNGFLPLSIPLSTPEGPHTSLYAYLPLPPINYICFLLLLSKP